MLVVRRVWTVLVGFLVASWVARGVFDWLLGLDEPLVSGIAVGCGLLGAALSVPEARRLEPRPAGPFPVRDTAVGILTALAVILAVGFAVAPLPWGPVAAVGTIAVGLGVVFLVATVGASSAG